MEPIHLNLPVGKVVAAAFGVFDGVHAGHRSVIAALRECARACGGAALAVTFDPHPRAVLGKPGMEAPQLLLPLNERIKLLAEAGADYVVTVHFTAELAQLTPAEFLDWVAPRSQIRLGGIAVGANFRFGRDGAGDAAFLRSYAAEHGLDFRAVPPLMLDGERVSSSRIRRLAASGRLEEAARLLGREYGLFGTIVHGYRDASGKLDCPTANLEIDVGITPPDGVYAAWGRFSDGVSRPAVVNLGWSPTWHRAERARRIEVHLLDFAGNCYGRRMELVPIRFLRAEREFPDVSALKTQIQQDVARAREALSGRATANEQD